MSRLAKRKIVFPKTVDVKLVGNTLKFKGAKGELSLDLMDGIKIDISENSIEVSKTDKLKKTSFLGLYWALIRNNVVGVEKGFEKKLKMIGVGYKAQLKANKLDLSIGYSNPVLIEIPKELKVSVEKSMVDIVISGASKQQVGQFAAEVRAVRPPEPYKGKGIRYVDEYVRKKAGKAAKGKG